MKRFCLLAVCAMLFTGAVMAQNATSPETDEKLVRLSSDVERLLSINADLQKQMSGLREELASVREKANKAGDDSSLEAMRADLKKLAEKIQEVDKKRVEDKEIVAAEFEKIEKLLKKGLASNGSTSGATRPSHETASNRPSDRPEKGYEYEVQSGDTLSGIVSQVNKQFKEEGKKPVTLKQVQDANPTLKPERMMVGQKIFIPTAEK